jgi:hypothetical protein
MFICIYIMHNIVDDTLVSALHLGEAAAGRLFLINSLSKL